MVTSNLQRIAKFPIEIDIKSLTKTKAKKSQEWNLCYKSKQKYKKSTKKYSKSSYNNKHPLANA